MNRILVIGDLIIDRYRFLTPLRSDPANNNALVVERDRQESVNGGAGFLVRNLESLCENKISFFHAPFRTNKLKGPNIRCLPMKTRYYIEDRFILREDKGDSIKNDKRLIDKFIDEIKDNDYVVISDYHKGTIKYSDIKKILDRCNETNITFIDTNHVQPEHEGADWLKINYETARESVNIFGINIAKKISAKTGTNVIVTRGEDGFIAYLRENDESIYYTKDEYKNGTKHFVDSIGAGDTFFAGFISAMINKKKIIPSLIYADVVAHLSTTQLGTIKVVDKAEADSEYKHIKTTTEENGGAIYVHRTIIND